MLRSLSLTLFLGSAAIGGAAVQSAPPLPISLDLLWYRYADPGAEAHPDAPLNPLTGLRDGLETDRGEVGGESAVISPDGRLVITASRSNARVKDPGVDPPPYSQELNGNTSHIRLYDIDGNLLWDRGRSRGPDNINNRTGADEPDGIPDNVPLNDDGEPEDELEHAEFTTHPSNAGRYVVAAGEDNKIEVWEIMDENGTIRDEPVLVRTLFIPGERSAAFDSLGFSNSGELLTGGTEFKGHVEVWRATGHPSTWEHVGNVSHGRPEQGKFRVGAAVNEFDWSSDDRYFLTAGTDQWGVFWSVDITRDPASDEITDVAFTRLASMDQPQRSCKAARFNATDRLCIIASKDQRTIVFDVEDLKNHHNPDTAPPPVVILNNGIYHGTDSMTGVEIEPGGATNDGRFIVVGGGPEENFDKHPNDADYRSSFFRIFEVREIQGNAASPDATEPDPIWVQPAFHTEFFFFHSDDTLLATSHDDGTARLWDVAISDTYTIASESFNEPTDAHNRWTLFGLLAEPNDNEWGVTYDRPANLTRWEDPPGEFMTPSVGQDTNWVGHRGARYLGADNLQGETHALELTAAWDIAGYEDLLLNFAAAAERGNFESGDFLRLLADTNGDGTFETKLAEFLPNADGDLALDGDGTALGYMFQDFRFALAPFLPEDFDGSIRFRIEANTDSSDEELCFDTLRITGQPQPMAALQPSFDGFNTLSFGSFPAFHYVIRYGSDLTKLQAAEMAREPAASFNGWTMAA